MPCSKTPEFLRSAVDQWTKDPARSADRAVSDHDGCIPDGIPDLVMIADELDGVSLCLVADDDANDEFVRRNFAGRCAGKGFASGLIEHLIGFETEIEEIENDPIEEDEHRKTDPRAKVAAPGRAAVIRRAAPLPVAVQRPGDQQYPHHPEPDAVMVDKIGQANRVRMLAAGERHDKIDTENFGGK